MFSYKKWRKKQENLQVGEIVMLKYAGQVKYDYRVCKVTAIHPNNDGLVRKVTVSYRKRDSREPRDVYNSKPLTSEQVGVHRLYKLDLCDKD